MFLLRSVYRFNPQSSFCEHASSPAAHNWQISWELKLRLLEEGRGRSQPSFNYNPFLQHITVIESTQVAFRSPHAQATAVVPYLSADDTQCAWTSQTSSPELQQNPVTHSASSSLLGSAGFPRDTNPKELGWKQMGKRERVCLCFYFLPGSAFRGKKKNRALSWCPAKLPPSHASPSTPPSVQTV